jgi:hypothetical protein
MNKEDRAKRKEEKRSAKFLKNAKDPNYPRFRVKAAEGEGLPESVKESMENRRKNHK